MVLASSVLRMRLSERKRTKSAVPRVWARGLIPRSRRCASTKL